MGQNQGQVRRDLGASAPALGALRPSAFAVALALALPLTACGGDDETRRLDPLQLGMTSNMGSIYDDGEVTLYEVKMPVLFPIKAPSKEQQAQLNSTPKPPFPSAPWLLMEKIGVQVTWTLTNLDPDDHAVEVLVDPWNEYGRYWPGMAVVDIQDEELQPNLSGIDILMELPGTASGRPSRKHGTFTFQDMEELAIDFATVMNIIATAPPPDPNAEYDNTVTLVNHAFAVENRSHKDLLVKGYIPSVIPGLTGLDIGLRTREPANIAIEIVVELVDKGEERVLTRDGKEPPMVEQTNFVTVGAAGGMP